MLQIIRSIQDLPYGDWMEIYTQSNQESGRREYHGESEYRQLLNAEQDHYQYLRDVFFSTENAFGALWRQDGRGVAALRIEPYRNGYLITGLETAPGARGKGYATALVKAVLSHMEAIGAVPVYAHVDKKNFASLAVHKAAGFTVFMDHAVYLDGSVLQSAYTLCYTR